MHIHLLCWQIQRNGTLPQLCQIKAPQFDLIQLIFTDKYPAVNWNYSAHTNTIPLCEINCLSGYNITVDLECVSYSNYCVNILAQHFPWLRFPFYKYLEIMTVVESCWPSSVFCRDAYFYYKHFVLLKSFCEKRGDVLKQYTYSFSHAKHPSFDFGRSVHHHTIQIN